MNCAFCGLSFEPDQATAGCPPCPLTRACGRMRCPRCGYEAVPPSPLLDRLRRIFLRNPRPPAPALKPSPSLVDLAVGDEARVSGLAYDGTSHDAARLVAMGVLPGASVRLLRRSPAFVFQLGNSQFAIDEQIANRILIRSPELENTR